ncbi:DUF6493 family protein [Frondihabitans cladoniiphilus]|uniref:DUF6493 domain-containing protein n=1 Tax=Frondihabitans cladoniiphilus TaxID=715785 RepID=A0ABP8VHE1_9MICO
MYRVTEYKHLWDFYRDLSRLLGEGATLRDLYEALLMVPADERQREDGSPAELQSLSQWWSQSPSFVPIRLRELFEGLEVPHGEDYVLAMVGHLGGRHEQEVRLHLLRHDSQLRDDLFWRIFEVEGNAGISLANVDKYSSRDLDWHRTVIRLVDEGTINRARVLRSCLEALNRDFASYRAGWFSKTYNALVPDASEAAADQALLRQCLGSSVTATVSLAATHLALIHKQGLLEAPQFVEACAAALSGPKAAAVGILRILETIAGDDAVSVDAVVSAASSGLAHPHVDVQRASIRLLQRLGREDIARDSSGDLAPAVVAELLPSAAPVAAVARLSDATPGRSLAAAPVQPWSDEDARERFAEFLEFRTSALDLELALAWLAITENAASTLTPLLKRALRSQPDGGDQWLGPLVQVAVDPETIFLPRPIWQRTRMVLVDGVYVERPDGQPTPLRTEEERTALPSLVTRLREVASILQGRTPRRRLLATPTDTQGWIDPDVLLERFDSGPVPLPVDLTQAILRIRPADRDRITRALGAERPVITEAMSIEWTSRVSSAVRPSGSPKWIWWSPVIVADPVTDPSPLQPALIPSITTSRWDLERRQVSPLVAGALGLVDPSSTLPFAAVAVPVMHSATSEVNLSAGTSLSTLASHPGVWTSETAQVLALGMAALRAEHRTHAAELFAAAIPSRISPQQAAIGFAGCQPAIALSRWASSLSDAAMLAPDAVVDLLTHLLPRLPRAARGIGALVGLLLDESLRHHRAVSDPALRVWLAAFTGSSGTAKAARGALALG